jgi:hypothetical protein
MVEKIEHPHSFRAQPTNAGIPSSLGKINEIVELQLIGAALEINQQREKREIASLSRAHIPHKAAEDG